MILDVPATRSSFFDSVFLIEGLAPHERPTGRELFDGTLVPLAEQFEHFTIEYRQAKSSTELSALVQDELLPHAQAGHAPILHIESHGTEEGLVLPQDFVSWDDVRGLLTEVNRACQMNLVVVVAACHGGKLVSRLLPTHRAFAWAVIGPFAQDIPSSILRRTQNLYRTLLSAFDWHAVGRALNAPDPEGFGLYEVVPAERMFRMVVRRYIKDACTPQALAERENRIVAEVVRRQGLDLAGSAEVRLAIHARLADRVSEVEQMIRHFFMLDLFPHLRERFSVTPADVIPAA